MFSRCTVLSEFFKHLALSKSSTTDTLSNRDHEQLYDDFIQMSLGELQDYLSLRKRSISRKKRELVGRGFAACEQGVQIGYL